MNVKDCSTQIGQKKAKFFFFRQLNHETKNAKIKPKNRNFFYQQLIKKYLIKNIFHNVDKKIFI